MTCSGLDCPACAEASAARTVAALPIAQSSGHDGQVSGDSRSDFEAMLAATQTYEPQFLGLTESEAVELAGALGIRLRVIRDDTTALTADRRARRITVDLRTGTVTEARAG